MDRRERSQGATSPHLSLSLSAGVNGLDRLSDIHRDTGATTLDCTGHASTIRKSPNSGERFPACAVLATRNDKLLLRLPASFLFR